MNPTVLITLGASLGNLLLASVFTALWYKERDRFFTLGAAAWLANGVRFMAESALAASATPAFWMPLVEAPLVANGVLLLAAAYALRNEPLPRIWIWTTSVVIFWILLGAMGLYHGLLMVGPPFLFAAVVLVRAGFIICGQRSVGGPAALFLGGTIILWALVEGLFPVIPPGSRLLVAQVVVQIILGVVALVCTLLFILERWRRNFRRTAQHLEASIEQAADAVFVTDPYGRYIEVNRQACQLLRCRSEQLIGRTPNDILGPGEDPVDPAALRAYKVGEVTRRERVLRRFDETLVEVEISSTALTDGRLQAMVRDISEWKRTQRALKESDDRFRTLMEHLPVGVGLWDKDFRYAYINPVLAAANRKSVEAHRDKTVREVLPEAADQIEAILRKVMTTGETIKDLEIRDPSVRPLDLVRIWSATFFPVYGEDQRVTGVGCCAVDFTDRKLAEEQIAEQAAWLDRASDAISVRDLDQSIRYWGGGAERIYGWAMQDVVGETIDRRLGLVEATVNRLLAETMATGEAHATLAALGRDGTPLTIESRWTLLRGGDGQPEGFLVIDTDVTERKQLQEQVSRIQRLENLGALAGGVAHDLNNLLSPILLSVQHRREQARDADEIECLSLIEASARRGSQMVNQVLSFAKGLGTEFSPVDVGTLISEITSFVRENYPESVRVESRILAPYREVKVNPTQLHQVLINLCNNARDAMSGDGVLTIEVDNHPPRADLSSDQPPVKGTSIEIRITDTGQGIPEDIRARIYDPFFTTKGPDQGSGLGLSMVKSILEAHDGSIDFETEPGRGTVFRIRLPLADEAPASEDTLPRGQGQLILVVDDEASVLNLIQQTLTGCGYRVVAAQEGVGALSRFAEHQADLRLVILDLKRSNMDRVGLIRSIRRINPDLPILDLGGEEIPGMGGEGAAPVCLARPFDTSQILNEVARLLAE